MGPIELLFIAIGLIVTLIGIARGYVRELGSTLLILSALFLLTFFQEEITQVLTFFYTDLLGINNPDTLNGLLAFSFSGAFVAIVFASYAGKTLTFSGRPAAQPGRFLLDVSVGLLNGYLIAGTLWYIQDIFGYPLGGLTGLTLPLTARAQAMIPLLPPNLVDNPVFWIVPVVILLILMVRG
jgi:hypothetical protein